MLMRISKTFENDMIDYLKWRGDVKISPDNPVNEVDYLIMARLSYFPYHQIALAPRESIKSFCKKMAEVRRNYYNIYGDTRLVKELINSTRFNKLIVSDCVTRNDRATEKQFGAITIHLPNNELCVSYLGTDASLVGWKEDFNMTFMPTIPSQELALEYLERIAKKYPTHKLRVCGHSKGGNIAVFAALSISTQVQKRIIDVVNFDGPGFIPDFVKVKFHRSAEMLQKVHNYIPQDSMFGRLLEQDGDRTVVFSRENGLYQHDVYSWQVCGPIITRAEKIADSSEIFNQTIIDFLKNRDLKDRKTFVDTVYDILCSTDFDSMDDIRDSWFRKLPNLVKSYRQVKPEDRDVLTGVVKQIAGLYIDSRRRYTKEQKPTKNPLRRRIRRKRRTTKK